MKKSKILAFLTALTMVSSVFSAFSITANAETTKNPVPDGIVLAADYAGLDSDNYHVFNFKLEDKESKLSAITGSKKYTGNVLDKIQFVINFDETIFDKSEIYVTKTSQIVGGLTTTSKDGELPVKYAWIQSDYTATLGTIPTDYIVSVAVLTKGTYSESEMLAGITFDGTSGYRIQNFDGTSKEPKYTTDYRLDGLGDYVPTYRIGEDTPTPSEKAAVAGKAIEDGFKTFSTDAAIEFTVGATPTIEISKSGTTDKLTETLGSGVIGEGKTKIIPIVSYKIDRNGVAAGDIFTIKVTNGTDTSSWTYTVPAE